ncbi:MAG: SCO family protein, partial [Pseudomonadota bacterium]|nr:SCO family protein [Pseudomonadota bacterium]
MFNRRMLITGLVGSAATALMQPAAARSATQPKGKSRSSFPNTSLITHEGKSVRFYDDLLRGKTVLINMMYAQCEGICPGMTANLSRVQKALGDQVGRTVFMYSLTLQ